MTSTPASRSARATTLAPRSCPSRPGLAMTIRMAPMTSSRGDARPDGHHPQRTHATKPAAAGAGGRAAAGSLPQGRVAGAAAGSPPQGPVAGRHRAAARSELLYRRVAQDQVLDAVLAAK